MKMRFSCNLSEVSNETLREKFRVVVTIMALTIRIFVFATNIHSVINYVLVIYI